MKLYHNHHSDIISLMCKIGTYIYMCNILTKGVGKVARPSHNVPRYIVIALP